VNATVERAAWLASDVLLLMGSGEGAADETPATFASLGERPLQAATRALQLTSNGREPGHRVLLVSRFRRPVKARKSLKLSIGSGDSALSVDPDQLSDSTTDPATFLREELSALAPERRREALDLLWAAAAPSLEKRGSFLLATVLAQVRSDLRPPLPPMVMTPDEPNCANIDLALEINPGKVWIEGWMRDRDGTAVRLTLLAPEGGRVELMPNMFRYRRSDMDEYYGDKYGVSGRRHGFIRYAELDGPSYLSSGWLLELETANGWAVEKPLPDLNRDPIEVRNLILLSLREERPGSDELMREHTHPAIAGIQDRLREVAAIETVVQLGKPPSSPAVSVIVPLYKELSFLEFQMAHWAKDPQMPQADLIYVLDSPEQAEALDGLARGLHSIYGIPLRIAVMKGNAGFAGVNNCAAQLARAGKLLLLNSDVVPSAPGWLARMSAFYDAIPDIGALGPKLLYHDGSLQHAGMYFYRFSESEVWENMHYFKGQHRYLPAANVTREVPAVTGACMMIDRGLYEAAGGLSHQYVQGGYEDSDLCLRLSEKGRRHWYIPDVELYHLEEQSYPKDVREQVTGYNMWLHTELWGDRMQELMERFRDSTR
jgi:O-antigen biosynthesis protein